MILISLDLGINTGVTVIDPYVKKINFEFFKYKNTPDALKSYGTDLNVLIENLYKKTQGAVDIGVLMEFSNFSKSKIAYLSHFGMVGITYSITTMHNAKILTPKKQQGLGVPPQTVNTWCAKKLGIPSKIYKDAESIALAKSEKGLLTRLGWKFDNETLIDKNQHVADSFHIGLWGIEELLNVSV